MTHLCASPLSEGVRELLPVATIADLYALADPGETVAIDVLGYYAKGDGGGGGFYYDTTSTATDNGGTVIKPTAVSGAGRWLWTDDTSFINVLRFGVKRDGTTDNTTTMAAAKAAAVAAATDGVLFFPSGSYKGSLALSATDDNLTIRGESWDTTFLEAKDNSTTTLEVAAGCNYVTIENLYVKNTGATNNGTHYGIRSLGDGAGNGASGLTLKNVKVDGYNINVKLDEFNNHYLQGVWSTSAVHGGAAAPSGSCIYAGHATNHSVGIWLHDCHTVGGKFGYYINTAEGLNIAHSDSLLSTASGFIHTTSDATAVTGMFMSNVQFDSSAADAALNLTKVDNGAFANVWCSASVGGVGLMMETCSNNTFSSLEAVNCVSHGVHIKTGCNGNTFASPVITGNGGDGIRIDSGATGNVFNVPTTSNNTGQDFQFNDATAASPNIINVSTSAKITVNTKDWLYGTPSKTWTPTDASGAGLSLTAADGRYVTAGPLVTAYARITYPATADGSNAKIGGLPFAVANLQAALQGFVTYTDGATGRRLAPNATTTNATWYTDAGASVTNAQMTGVLSYITLQYEKA